MCPADATCVDQLQWTWTYYLGPTARKGWVRRRVRRDVTLLLEYDWSTPKLTLKVGSQGSAVGVGGPFQR